MVASIPSTTIKPLSVHMIIVASEAGIDSEFEGGGSKGGHSKIEGHFNSSLAALSHCSTVHSASANVFVCVGAALFSFQSCHCDNC